MGDSIAKLQPDALPAKLSRECKRWVVICVYKGHHSERVWLQSRASTHWFLFGDTDFGWEAFLFEVCPNILRKNLWVRGHAKIIICTW